MSSVIYPPNNERIIVEALIGESWVDLSSRVRGTAAGSIALTVGRADESSRIQTTRATLTLDNADGYLSDRNPLSPYFGLLGRNTQLRISLNEIPAEGAAGGGGSSVEAPDTHVTYTGAATLLSFWLASDNAPGTFNFTVPGSMVAGSEVDGTFASSRYATEAITGPIDTGGRTATLNTPADRVAGLNLVLPGAPTLAQADSDSNLADITLTTGGTPVVGDWLLVLHGHDLTYADVGDEMAEPTGGPWYLVGDSEGILGTSARIKAWVRPVTTAGAQSTTLVAGTHSVDNHGRLFLVTDGWPGGYPIRLARRFWGEVPEWPSQWDVSGNDVKVTISAAGIMRRLGQGAKQLKSPMYREATNDVNASYLGAYWPLEDGAGATSLASAVSGAIPMKIIGDVSVAADSTSFPGSSPLPTMGSGSSLFGYVPPYTNTGTIQVRALFAVPAAGLTDGAGLIELVAPVPPGTIRRWSLRYRTNGQLSLHGLGPGGVEVHNSGLCTFDVRGQAQMIAFSLTQNGANVDWEIWTREIREDGTVVEGGTGATFNTVTIYPPDSLIVGWGGLLPDVTVGHIMYGTSASLAATIDTALIGHAGETAGARIARLCSEESVQLVTVGDMDTTALVGPQRIDTLLNLLYDAADADRGILSECRYEFALQFRARRSLYSQQDDALTLNYDDGHMTAPFLPVDDDQLLWNDVTVERTSGTVTGSSARSVQTTGRLTPEIVGTYDRGKLGVNVYRDSQLPDLAGWLKHLGTIDEARYPESGVILSRTAFTGTPARLLACVALDLGDVVVIEDTPSHQAPGPVENMVQGYSEWIDNDIHSLRWNSTPASAYRVAIADADSARGDTAGSELHASVTSGATTLEVATTSGPLWTTTDAHYPFDIVVGGEVMTVTDIVPPATPTMQVGVVAHGNNASVVPALPASVAAEDLLLCLAAIRNSGTGVVAGVTGYEPLIAHGNMALYGRIATSSESAPTVSFTGGVANADTSAQIVRFRGGKYHSVLTALRRYARALNASAQDIAYPGLTVPEMYNLLIYCGWKQDDWTSVTSPGTEIGEPDTVTGDDQGLVWSYEVQGATPASILAGSFVVTGGAVAISRGMVVGITDDRQTFTVTRSVNGVVKAHSAGAEVKLRYPMIPGL